MWGALAASCILASAAASAAAPGPLPPEDDKELGRAILKELVEINTTHAVGSTVAAHAIEQHLLKAGFAADDVVFVAPSDHPTKGNVVVKYRGKGGRAKPLLFLGHLDVVEAKPEDWSVDPFKLTEKDGWYYGRGTIDMKDGDAAMLEALIRLKRERFKPERDIIVAFTADYDLSGVWIDVDENRSHGRDERVGVREFDESVEYTYRLMKVMSGAR